MDRDPTTTAARKARRRKKLAGHLVCVRCGEERREALEVHHPAGRAHDPPRESDRCKNCHGTVTEAQRDACVQLAPQRDPPRREIARHRALAVDKYDEAKAEDRAATRMEEFLAFLDCEFPDWLERWEKRK